MGKTTGKGQTAAQLAWGLVGLTACGAVVGALVGDPGERLATGLIMGGAALLVGVVVGVVVWVREGRRAREFGLSTGRYLRIGREIRRGRLPEDPYERPAVVESVARQRRGLDRHQYTWYRWTWVGAAVLWLLIAADALWSGDYGSAALYVSLALLMTSTPFTLRRQRRRVASVERALAEAEQREAAR
ncbi:hypothetical protein [Streptomyces lichenis]|uniref:Integral membrane protein n=1 Tax=Streptomyces lichenis TaxID=2306967 RepID=A0ABT0I3N8_9ACTN|nr:hypothetical protein [Streptomyces lichenis]MCK8675924.1 hypothetical protein [Streptomyces lichenis]